MKILVPISKVPDTTAKIAFTDGNTKFATDNVTFILNPTDEWYALVRALEIVEKEGGTVTVIHQGAAESEQFIRKALAIGATDAVRIDAEATDAYQVAHNIFEYAKKLNPVFNPHPYLNNGSAFTPIWITSKVLLSIACSLIQIRSVQSTKWGDV